METSVSFVAPFGGWPLFVVNGIITLTDTQRQAFIKFDRDGRHRFTLGPDKKLDPSSIQKLSNIVSVPPIYHKLMAQKIPKTVLRTTSQAELSKTDNDYISQQTGVLKGSESRFVQAVYPSLLIYQMHNNLCHHSTKKQERCCKRRKSISGSCRISVFSNVPHLHITKTSIKWKLFWLKMETTNHKQPIDTFSVSVRELKSRDNLGDYMKEND